MELINVMHALRWGSSKAAAMRLTYYKGRVAEIKKGKFSV